MSKKDLAKEAALRAIQGSPDKKNKTGGKSSKSKKNSKTIPEKGSAEAEVHKRATKAKASNKKKAKSPLPKKGSAEAAAHNIASQTVASTKEEAKTPLPEKGSAEAEAHRQALKSQSSKPKKSNPIPQKGSAEAAAHNMASKARAGDRSADDGGDQGGSGKDGSGLGFLGLVLLLPLAIVGGLYGYAYYNKNGATTSNVRKPVEGKRMALPAPATALKKPATVKPATKSPKTPGLAKTTGPTKSTAPAKSAKNSVTPAPKPVPKPAKTVTPAKPLAQKAKTAATGQAALQWDYSNTNWASLDPSFKTCGSGRAQSPINIVATPGNRGPNFHFNYFPSNGKVLNTGHSVQVDLAKGNQLLVNGTAYELTQFHFHTPGENAINGRRAPMEAHLVHKNNQGQLVVVAVMIKQGGANQLIDRMPVPPKKGDSSEAGGAFINPLQLLPGNRRSFTFSGSLTTPPCTQNVGWIVMQQPVFVSSATLAKFQRVLGKNARPLQPANSRAIYTSN